jgi:PAS domain S-box-containing protein
MTITDNHSDNTAPLSNPGQPLRQRTETKIPTMPSTQSRGSYDALLFSPETQELPTKIQQALHELHVHKIELENQNEELRRTQAELEVARARYFNLYDLAPVGYVSVLQNGMISEANLTAAAMLGVTRSELVQKFLSSFIYRDDQDIYYLHLKKISEEKTPQSCESRLIRRNAQVFWARLVSSATQDADNEPVYLVALTDITERKQSEAKQQKVDQHIQQTQKLQSLGVLAGGIAHDFNNLMGGIFGYIDLALMETDKETISRYLNTALETIHRARSLTDKLLTFARGGAPVQKTTSLMPFIQELTTFAVSGSNVACQLNIQENLWPCKIDKSQISQAFSNIIINAQQSMPDGGTIRVSAGNIPMEKENCSTPAQQNYVKISIKDHGKGIAPEIMPHIFDPFYSTKPQGHGLGLTTSYSIIKRHGGYIECESTVGYGSEFHIFLPAAIEPEVVTATATSRHAGSGTIIVMDDEQGIREIMKMMIETMGYSVECTQNGNEALNFFIAETSANRPVAAMILDLTVPGGMGGVAAIAEIRKTNPEIPVFVTSGYSQDRVMAAPEEYGFTAGICKPFRRVELAELLEKYVKKG